ncbi:hypothetical protein ACJJTC_007684 [Scirpophaga incertulas]
MELTDDQLQLFGNESAGTVNKIKIPKIPHNSSHHDNKSQAMQSKQPIKKACKRCLRVHYNDNKCPAVNWMRFSCNQMGHTAKSVLCKNRVHNLSDEEIIQEEDDDDSLELGFLNTIRGENESLKVIDEC